MCRKLLWEPCLLSAARLKRGHPAAVLEAPALQAGGSVMIAGLADQRDLRAARGERLGQPSPRATRHPVDQGPPTIESNRLRRKRSCGFADTQIGVRRPVATSAVTKAISAVRRCHEVVNASTTKAAIATTIPP
jgi:hypothetical protein